MLEGGLLKWKLRRGSLSGYLATSVTNRVRDRKRCLRRQAAGSSQWAESARESAEPDQLSDSTALLKIGFALYDVKRYDESLAVFEKMQERAGADPYDQAVTLIWQGHMLDLLGRREEAISRYRIAAGMNVEGTEQHDQFGLAYSPSSYARQRIETPFARVENRFED